ncbi:kinesin motor domain protein [Ceratobasidium sp. AG-Ba]|nr:kinesin motor domain protein [Ceratobasidium sp. AG-Ba]
MPPVTRNKAPASASTSPVSKARATRSTSVKPPSASTTSKPADSKAQLAKSTSTATSTAPPPKPAGGTLSRSTTNRMSVVLPTPKHSAPNTAGTSDKTTATKGKDKVKDDDKEPIRAFLRIRPAPLNASTTSTPYIQILSNTAVDMTDPSPSAPRFGMRPSLAPAPSTTYTFTRVFPPETLQPEFFASTALPLVKDLLNGENGLAFAYGVTNSGKTWTIQGGSGQGEGGLLPRTLDVLFNSIEGLHADNAWRPAGCSSVEQEPNYGPNRNKGSSNIEPDVESLLGADPPDKDDTVIKVDRNYEYSVFVSYAEIYNEKIFDLLATSSLSPEDAATSAVSRSNSSQSLVRAAQSTTGGSQAKPLPRYLSAILPKSITSHLGFSSSTSGSGLASNPAWGAGDVPGTLSRKALALKSDPMTGGKYISGIREIRVRTAEEGKAILKLGQINRTVFGTMANERSSRSHAVFTIKVLKVHKGADKNDPEEVQCARLSVVDLAGSERSRNTQATGDRLKEAGNINKSLMVLGQCMEMLRANQRKIAAGATLKLGLVPFRHSKMTELFQDFFVGEGRAVMIVNVNPYDTGFDENSHVMKFSALARDVATTTTRAVTRAPPAAKSSGLATVGRASSVKALVAAAESRAAAAAAGNERTSLAPVRTARKVRLSEGTPAETVLEVVEEDEAISDEDDDIPRDTLVEELFEEVEWLREKLYEAEMRASMIEAEVREEVTREMEERMQVMERMHSRRLASEVEAGELKTDRKIDMLQRTGLIPARQEYDTEEEDNVDKSLMVDNEEGSETEEDDSSHGSPAPRHRQLLTGAPLATLSEGESFVEETPSVKDEYDDEETHGDSTMEAAAVLQGDVTGGEISMSVDERSEEDEDEEDEEVSETEEESSAPKARTPSKAAQKQRASSDDEDWQAQEEDEEDDEEEYEPSPPVRAKQAPRSISPTKIPRPASPVKARAKVQVKEEEASIALDKDDDDDDDESMSTAAIVPNKRLRAARLSASGPKSEYVPAPGEPETVKKKKRQLGKGAALTEDQIWQVAMKAEEQERKASTVRRLGRGSR